MEIFHLFPLITCIITRACRNSSFLLNCENNDFGMKGTFPSIVVS